MNDPFAIRVMTPRDVALAGDWAAAEGWNPGLADAACFTTVDPDGFHIGELGGTAASTISVVNYDDGFSFLGFYIVRPDLRGRGYGLRTWQAAIAHAGTRMIGLDGVVAQQDNYRKSGFVFAHRNIRFGGVPVRLPDVRPDLVDLEACLSRRSTPTMRRCFRRRGGPSCTPGSTRRGMSGARCCATAGSPPGA